MIGDDEARRLLHAAGETIEVSPGAALPRPARRRTPWLAAAAVVAVIAGGGLVATQVGGDGDASPEPAPATSAPAPDELPDTLPDGALPSLLGMTVGAATARLEQLGAQVQVEEESDCLLPEGRVIATRPGAGLPVPSDEATTVVVSGGAPPTAACAYTGADLWELVDLGSGTAPADGGSSTLRFSDEVAVVLDGGEPMVLTAASASDPATWADGTALAVFADAVREVRPPTDDGEPWVTPEISGRMGLPPLTECGVTRPGSAGDLEVRTLQVSFPGEACPAAIDVFRLPSRDQDGQRNQDGEIVAIFARTAKAGTPESAPVPDVVGMSDDQAAEAIIEAGFAVSTHIWERCKPGEGVTEQAPRAASELPLGSTVSLTVEVDHPRAHCTGLPEAADALLAWARGGDAPALADEVLLMQGHELVTTLTGEARSNPGAWALCPAEPGDCANALTTLASYDGDLERRWYEDDLLTYDDGTLLVDCTADLGGYPRAIVPEGRLTLHPPATVPCEAMWSVSLWVDAQGRISAVDLAPTRQ